MAILHTLNRSPAAGGALEACLRLARPGAALLLYEDGVYAALAGVESEPAVRAALARLRVHALGPDLAARGIEPERLIEGIEVVDHVGFVDLAVGHRAVQAWT